MKYNIAKLALAGIMILPASGVWAQKLSIEECRQMALEHNKDKESARLSTEAAQYTKKSVWAQFFPSFSLAAFGLYDTGTANLSFPTDGLTQTLSSVVTSGVQNGALSVQQAQWLSGLGSSVPKNLDVAECKVDWVYAAALTLKQPLYMGGKIRASYRMADLAVLMNRQGERLAETQVIQGTDEAYAGVVKAEELVQVAGKYGDLLAALHSDVESAVRHGLALDNDLMKVEVKQNEVALQLRRAENAVRLAKMNLCHHIGKPLSSDVEVSGEYPAVADASTLQTDDVSARPEYAVLEHSAELAKQQEKVARSDMRPQLALLAKYGYTHGGKVNGDALVDGWNFGGGVTLSVPLYHFGERTNKVKAARTKWQQACLEKDNKEEMMLLEVAQAANSLDEARLEVELSEKSLTQAESSMKLSGQRYKAGTEKLSDYLEAQASWQKAYETKVNAHFQLYLSSVNYLRSAGHLVEE